MRRYLLFLTLPLFLADYASKEWCVRRFAAPSEEGHDGIVVVEGYFNLVRVHNTGIAFGMANGKSRSSPTQRSLRFSTLVPFVWP